MITKEKLEIYSKYGGIIDGLSHVGTEEQKKLFSDDDWSIIDDFVQDIIIVKNKLASTGYAENLQNRLIENCSSKEVIDLLMQIADKMKR